MSCITCTVGWHHKCRNLTPVNSESEVFVCCCSQDSQPSIFTIPRTKDGASMKDVLSTGRKRAVKIKEIDKENPGVCEWAYLAKAGGGVEPIVGCAGEPQKHVHHGPDKSTLNNDPLNLHAVCHKCHNRWHAKNDKYYGKRPDAGEAFLPVDQEWIEHDPDTKISLQELLVIEGERSGKK